MNSLDNLTGDYLRNEFAKRFSYAQITCNDIQRLTCYVMRECAIHNLAGNGVLEWPRGCGQPRGFEYNMAEDGEGMHSAFIRVDGMYFTDREAISFNDDGFIGFAGWSDSKNVQPFYRAFKSWMDEKTFGTEIVRGAYPLQPIAALAC